MARVTADLIDGEVRLSTAGNSVRRLFQVRELSGAPAHRLAEAATTSGVPRVGDAHPSIASVLVSDVRASATNDPKIAIVEVTYGVPQASDSANSGGIDIAILSDLYTEETITDVNGEGIYTTFFSTSASSGSFSTTLETQTHRIEVQRPTFSVQFSRIEDAPPLAKARAYAGKVNAGLFLSEPADRWLCNVESYQESAERHRVRYTFTLNPDGWQAKIFHSTAGIVPATASIVNGIRNVQVYKRTSFSPLRLPSV